MTNKTKTILGIVGGVVVLGTVGAAMNGNEDKATSSLSSSTALVSTISSASETSLNSSETSQNVIPARETAIGKSDKSIDGIMTIKAMSVRNDKTGNWRYSAFSESGLDISEYALSYYKEYFKSDNEIHAAINFANKTTSRISCASGMLFVTVMEYVDGEEHDAALLFSGKIIKDYIVYIDNGDIEIITETIESSIPESSVVESSNAPSSEPTSEPSTTSNESETNNSTSQSSVSSVVASPTNTTPENHFNDHNNPEQQQTTEYVLNTSTLRIHFASCNDVKKISAENYATTTDFNWAISNGYKSCGHCHAR